MIKARALGSKVYLYFMKKGRQVRHRIPLNSGLFISPYTYFSSFSEYYPATIRYSSVVLGRFIEQVNAECFMQESQLCLSTFLKISLYP